VCEAFKKVDRKLFVPRQFVDFAYLDEAISLDKSSSISQPSLVADMINLLELKGRERVLEIGTASGYSAAILSLCTREVDTGDGSAGLPSKAPFDGIVVAAAAKEIPKALIDQLKEGGRIVIPIQIEGSDMQELVLGTKRKNHLTTKPITVVKFVPLV